MYKNKKRGRNRVRFALAPEDILDLRMQKLVARLEFAGAFVSCHQGNYKISIKPWVEVSTLHELRVCGTVWTRVLHILSREKHFFKITLLVFSSLSVTLENLMFVTDSPIPFEKFKDDPFLVREVSLPVRVYEGGTFRLAMNDYLEYIRPQLESVGYSKPYGASVPSNRILEIIVEMV